jgi:hypothetical protein
VPPSMATAGSAVCATRKALRAKRRQTMPGGETWADADRAVPTVCSGDLSLLRGSHKQSSWLMAGLSALVFR